ncbi:MAG: phosphoesterase, partial [Actinomycetales bacterium]
MNKKHIVTGIAVSSLVLLTLVAFDFRLKVVNYKIVTDKVNKPIRIALLTDLHSQDFGENQEKLFSLLDAEKPDVVLMAGDIFDDDIPHDNCIITLQR